MEALFHYPAVDVAGLAGEVHADAEKVARVVGKLAAVSGSLTLSTEKII